MENSVQYKNPALSADQRVEDLLARMTLPEKLAQMTLICLGHNQYAENVQTAPQTIRPDVGAVLSWLTVQDRNKLQRHAVEQTRLGIPILFGADVIHGFNTIYPIPLAQACSFNPPLVERACSMAAREARAKGLNWTYAPMLDVPRDPRWGRVMESFGEDPCLAGLMGAASVRGYQGQQVAACPKHFIGYAESEGGRDYQYTDISSRALYETHLPPYEAAIQAGAATVMSAYNDINGMPASCNRATLTDILRGQLGFDGFVVSDWGSVEDLVVHGVAEDARRAAEKAVNAGVDMNMVGGSFEEFLGLAVEQNTVAMDVIDEAVRRILRVKFRLGLFDHPWAEEAPVAPAPTAHRQLAKEMAIESFVLLKNDNALLPLDAGKLSSIAIIGPAAAAEQDMLSTWATGSPQESVTTILAGIAGRTAGACTTAYAKGCEYTGDDTSGFAEAIQLAEKSDVVVLCLGEPRVYSGENKSRATLGLPGVQEDLLEALKAAGKPLVVVLSNGRPLALERVAAQAGALLEIWLPGVEAGPAVAAVLFGDVSPSGRLSMTFPRNVGQVPIYYALRRSGHPDKGKYIDCPTDPLYEFGHGLTYTSFEYGEITLSGPVLERGEKITATVTVTNTGNVSAKETVLWYVHDHVASLTRPMKELRHFEKKEIAPGASCTFSFEIDPDKDFSFSDASGNRVLEPGDFTIWAGERSAALKYMIL